MTAAIAFAGMHQRCNPKAKIYTGATVCSTWNDLDSFSEWWSEHRVQGYQLDKDLIVLGNMEYHPDKCVYVPSYLNKLLTDSAATRGELPLGVSASRTTNSGAVRYRVGVSNNGIRSYSSHSCVYEAHRAWQQRKAQAIEDTVMLYQCEDSYDTRVVESLLSVRDMLIHSAKCGIVTTSVKCLVSP